MQKTVCLVAVLMLAGCKQIDGTYYPGCVAYEGDKIVLRDGSVEWDRFTDQMFVDADGNAIDPFPGYPKAGRYEVDGDLLYLRFDEKDAGKTLHIRRSNGRVLLLNAENLAEWERTGQYNECVLTLAPEEAT